MGAIVTTPGLAPYISAKLVLAEPMTKKRFYMVFKGGEIPPEAEEEDGYHVRYSNPNGTVYDSWSPKDQFERSHRALYSDEFNMVVANTVETAAAARGMEKGSN